MNNKTYAAIGVIKFAVSAIVGAGTTTIVRTAIRNTVEPESLKDKVTVTAATVVIGSMAANAAKSYTDNTIDDIVDLVTNLRKPASPTIIEAD